MRHPRGYIDLRHSRSRKHKAMLERLFGYVLLVLKQILALPRKIQNFRSFLEPRPGRYGDFCSHWRVKQPKTCDARTTSPPSLRRRSGLAFFHSLPHDPTSSPWRQTISHPTFRRLKLFNLASRRVYTEPHGR